MHNIAVIGSGEVRCTFCVIALSVMAGVEITYHNLSCNIAENNSSIHVPVKDKWQVFFASALRAFAKQIEEEQHQGQFIINGGALYHLALAEEALRHQNNKSKTWKNRLLMFAGLKKVVLEYVRKQYKALIHIVGQPLNETDTIIAELLDDANVRYITIGAIMSDEEILNVATAFIGIAPDISASEAIRELNKKFSHSYGG